MAMFSSGGDQPRESSKRGPVGDNNLSIVAHGTRIVGELTTEGVVKVEGIVEGSLRAHQQVLVAKGGKVEGDIYTREAVIGGSVTGEIHADERVEVQRGSVVNGDITTQRMVVQEGAEVNGQVRMGRPGGDADRASASEEGKVRRMDARTPGATVISR